LFHCYLKSIETQLGAPPPWSPVGAAPHSDIAPADDGGWQDRNPLDDFAYKHSLTEAALQRMSELPIPLQDEIIDTFNPPASTRDVSMKLIAFVNSKTKGRQASHVPDRMVALDDFAQKWDLNTDAFQMLRELPVEAADLAMATFKPGPNTQDISRKFMSFARGKKGGGKKPPHEDNQWSSQQQKHPVDIFAEKWGLHQPSVDRLVELPIEHQEEIMAKFAPPPDTRDYNGRFISFLKNFKATPAGFAKRGRQEVSSDADRFGQSWGLSDEAMQVLLDLAEDLQHEVMSSFKPPAVKDISRTFIAYATKSLRSSENSRKRPRYS